jgi:GcrA cell cycle regulator
MKDGFWTTERIALLKRLWAQGNTANAIAAELGGLSRSAVLGKIFRLRLAPPNLAATQNSKTKREAKREEKHKRGKAARATQPDTPQRRRAAKAKPKARSKTSTRKTLLELTNDCCRWPYERTRRSGYFFCGAVGADIARGISYCPQHMRRAYVVPPCIVTPAPSLLPSLSPNLLPGPRPDLPPSPPRSLRTSRPERAA